MVRANIKRRILSRSVFHGEQENAIVSEMISGGDILQIKDTVVGIASGELAYLFIENKNPHNRGFFSTSEKLATSHTVGYQKYSHDRAKTWIFAVDRRRTTLTCRMIRRWRIPLMISDRRKTSKSGTNSPILCFGQKTTHRSSTC